MLTVIYGVMHGGKSERLCDAYSIADGTKIAMLPQKVMDAGSDALEVFGKGHVVKGVYAVETAFEKTPEEAQYVFIDEAQFCNVKEVLAIIRMAHVENRIVTCSFIEEDIMGVPFRPSKILLAAADLKVRVDRACECCGEENASHNVMVDENGSLVAKDDCFELESDDKPKYESVCNDCRRKMWLRNNCYECKHYCAKSDPTCEKFMDVAVEEVGVWNVEPCKLKE